MAVESQLPVPKLPILLGPHDYQDWCKNDSIVCADCKLLSIEYSQCICKLGHSISSCHPHFSNGEGGTPALVFSIVLVELLSGLPPVMFQDDEGPWAPIFLCSGQCPRSSETHTWGRAVGRMSADQKSGLKITGELGIANQNKQPGVRQWTLEGRADFENLRSAISNGLQALEFAGFLVSWFQICCFYG